MIATNSTNSQSVITLRARARVSIYLLYNNSKILERLPIYDMNSYTEEFNYINHTNFKSYDLFCSRCENILKSNIYTDVSKISDITQAPEDNICAGCYRSNEVNLKNKFGANQFLKRKLGDVFFPCLSEDCEFIGRLPEFRKHSALCYHGKVTCPGEDKAQFNSIEEFIEHLDTHGEIRKETLTAESVSVTPILDFKDSPKEIILANYMRNYFLIFIEERQDTISFKVWYYNSYSKYELDPKLFTIAFTNGRRQISEECKMYPLQNLLTDQAVGDYNEANVERSLLPPLHTVVIYFTKRELNIRLKNCENCSKPLLFRSIIRQCPSGHAFCKTCSQNTYCVMCQSPICKYDIKLDSILSNGIYPCENFIYGCLDVDDLSSRNLHGDVCSYRQILCPECEQECSNATIWTHLQNRKMTFNNFGRKALPYATRGTTYLSQTFYIKYRQNIFKIQVKSTKDSSLQFSAVSINFASTKSNYKIEIRLFKGDRLKAVLCTNCNDTTVSLGNDFCNDLKQNGQTLMCQYIISKCL